MSQLRILYTNSHDGPSTDTVLTALLSQTTSQVIFVSTETVTTPLPDQVLLHISSGMKRPDYSHTTLCPGSLRERGDYALVQLVFEETRWVVDRVEFQRVGIIPNRTIL
jgi:hypothetical protein